MVKLNIKKFLNEQQSVNNQIIEQIPIIEKITKTLLTARSNSKTIYTMGNGGSGSTASHFVSDLIKTAILKSKKRFLAISLVDNVPVILAWSNDVGYDEIFVEQLKNFVKKGDILVAFSGSGKSKNVTKALKFAKKEGAICIGFTGKKGGLFPKICDLCFIVPSNDMLIIESTHLMLCHCIIQSIRQTGIPQFKYE